MTNFLVPVDFSRAALNAAEYAMQMAHSMESATLKLLSVLPPMGIGSDGSPINEDEKVRLHAANQMLEALQVQLFEIAPVPIEIKVAFGEFLPELRACLSTESYDYVVMGIASASAIEEKMLGSSAIDVAQESHIPVVIVGEQMRFQPIKKVAVAVELNNVANNVAGLQIKNILDSFKAELHFVHANEDISLQLTTHEQSEKQQLLAMFESYQPQFAQVHMHQFVDAINTFLHQHEINMVLVMPRKHNIWQKFFGTNHTRQLAFHSVAPVAALHHV